MAAVCFVFSILVLVFNIRMYLQRKNESEKGLEPIEAATANIPGIIFLFVLTVVSFFMMIGVVEIG